MEQSGTPATMEVIVQRRLEVISSGNGAYLEMFLKTAKRAGLEVRIVLAPWRSFGNRPWSKIHPRFSALTKEIVWPRSMMIGDYYCSVSPTVWARFIVRLGKELMRRVGFDFPVHSFMGDPLAEKEAQVVAAACTQESGAIKVAEYSALGPALKSLNNCRLKGVLMHDLLADRGPRFRQIGITPDFLEITHEKEADWVSGADFCIFASANELVEFAPLVPNATCLWLPPAPPKYSMTSDTAGPRVVFLGTNHAGNEDALGHFIDEIWPHIVDCKPEIELWVVGSIGRSLPNARRSSSGIKVLGRIDDLAQIGGMNSIGVAPTRLATGVSIKVAEYLTLGMPCVAYPIALEGFGDILDGLVDVAGDPQEFASKVVQLLDDSAARTRRSESALAETRARLSDNDVVAYLRTVGASENDTVNTSCG